VHRQKRAMEGIFSNAPVWGELLGQLKHLLLRHVLKLAATLGLELVHVTSHEGGTASPAVIRQYGSIKD